MVAMRKVPAIPSHGDSKPMIAHLTGTIGAIESDRCVIDVGGVGYLLLASTRTLAALPQNSTATC